VILTIFFMFVVPRQKFLQIRKGIFTFSVLGVKVCSVLVLCCSN